jgi:hypothetical protein
VKKRSAGTARYKRNKRNSVQHPLAAKIVRYMEHVENGIQLQVLEDLLAMRNMRSGRPRTFTVKMLLVGLMLIADEGVLHLARIYRTLNGLDNESKRRLGITKTITRRQVEHLYNEITTVLAGENHSMFDKFCDHVLEHSHRNATKTGSLAVDGTSIESWGTRRTDKNTGEIKTSDPDAKWKKRSKDSPWKKPIFGYDLTAVVQVPNHATEHAPLFARSIRFRPATVQPVENALQAVIAASQQMQREQIQPMDVLADREYTSTIDGSGFLNPVRALGYNPVFELTVSQLGVSNTVKGAIIIDGQPHSPSTPLHLRHLIPPPVNAPVAEKIAYQDLIAARAKYALVRHGKSHKNGAQDYVCPAHAGKIACPLAGLMNPLLPLVSNTPQHVAKGSVCAKKYTRIHASDLPLNQIDQFGSFPWSMSMMRRNLVEGFFGNLKNEATENLKRGSIRVRGLYKTGLMVLFAVEATNRRLIDGYTPKTKTYKRRGRTPKLGIMIHNPIIDVRSNSPPQQTALVK